MREVIKNMPKPTEEEVEQAKRGFERMARRLDELWQKEKLTAEEEKEVELIFNNAAHVNEILSKEIPEKWNTYKR